MANVVQVVMVRHGETWWNRDKRLQGQTDTELSDVGRIQAEMTGMFLRKRFPDGFDNVLSSDLSRARETAEAIIQCENLETDYRLREMNLGIFQGKTALECRAGKETGESWKRFLDDADYCIPKGESRRDQQLRCGAALSELVLQTAENQDPLKTGKRRALLVSHGGALNCLYRFVNDLDLDDTVPHCGNCAVCIVDAVVECGSILKWKVIEWNQTSHLNDFLSTNTKTL